MAASTYTQRQISQALGRFVLNGVLFSVLVGAVAATQLFGGDRSSRQFWSLSGSVISIVSLYLYASTAQAAGQRSARLMVFSFCGLVPFIFGCYLFFVRGLWGLTDGLSLYNVARSIGFLVAGYGLAYSSYRLSDFIEAIRKGAIVAG